MDNKFRLWMFGDSRITIVTRGRTQEEAYEYACRNWKEGQTITLYPFNFVNSAKSYNKNHAFGWLDRMPKWLEIKETE